MKRQDYATAKTEFGIAVFFDMMMTKKTVTKALRQTLKIEQQGGLGC